jgi:hypothetical protein
MLMHVRLISMSGASDEGREHAIQTIRERVIPTVAQHDGYAGYVGLYDTDSGRAKALIFWESREAAEAAESELAGFRAQVVGGLGMTLESVELYEAPVVALA